MENRRKDNRYRLRLKGFVRFEGRRLRVQTENISVSGARIALDRPLLEGASVTLDLPLSEDPEARSILSGTVVWCTEDMEAGFQAGISFSVASSEITALTETLAGAPAA